jgi:hypothetical protein
MYPIINLECFKACEPQGVKPLTNLSELIVNALDSESIWNELQLRNTPLLKWARGTTSSLLGAQGAPKFNSMYVLPTF